MELQGAVSHIRTLGQQLELIQAKERASQAAKGQARQQASQALDGTSSTSDQRQQSDLQPAHSSYPVGQTSAGVGLSSLFSSFAAVKEGVKEGVKDFSAVSAAKRLAAVKDFSRELVADLSSTFRAGKDDPPDEGEPRA